jgi:hypothetical protein
MTDEGIFCGALTGLEELEADAADGTNAVVSYVDQISRMSRTASGDRMKRGFIPASKHAPAPVLHERAP